MTASPAPNHAASIGHASSRRPHLAGAATAIAALYALAGLAAGPVSAQQRAAPGPFTVNLLAAEGDKPLLGVTVLLGGRYAISNHLGAATFDGVPSGNYPLVVAQVGYDRIERAVTLSPGKREAMELKLVATRHVAAKGKVVLKDTARPVAGATLNLSPFAVATAVQGPCAAVTGWDGTFLLPELPVGKYRLKAAAIGCEAAEETVELKADMATLPVELTRTTAPADYAVTCVDALTGAPVAGARVVLAEAWPRGIIAEGRTDGAGHFTVTGVATGDLNWETETPLTTVAGVWAQDRNFLSLVSDGATLSGWHNALNMALTGQVAGDGRSATGTWQQVLDGEIGKATGRFTLGLNEGGTRLTGKRATAGQGEGAWGWERTRMSAVAVTRGVLTAQVEAAGYDPAATCRPAGTGGALTIRLNPRVRLAEQEPNNDVATAQAIPSGATVECRFGQPGDADSFRFRLLQPGTVRLEVQRPGDVWMRLELLSPAGTRVADCGFTGGLQIWDSPWLVAGDHVLRLVEWNNNAASQQPLIFHLTSRLAPDPWEPNNDLGTARPIRPGQEVRGWLAPPGDNDYFRFEVKRPSQVRFVSPWHPLWRRFLILDAAGKKLAEEGLAARDGAVGATLAPGSYYLQIVQWDNNNAHPDPYSIRMELREDDGVDDTVQPQGAVSTPRKLELGAQVGDTLFPERDRDYYMVTTPGSGRLHAWVMRPPELWAKLRVLAADRRVLAECGSTGGPAETSVEVEGPTTYFLEVVEWNDNAASTNPYLIRTWFEPCDETEALARNDIPDAAVPLELGEVQRGNLLPNGDEDWYSLTADRAGLLRITGVKQADPWSRLELYDAGGARRLAEVGLSGAAQPINWAVPVLAGELRLRVVEWNDNAGRPAPYELSANLVRVEPAETEPLTADAPRMLKPGEAQSWFLDQAGDRDQFVFAVAAANKFTLRVRKPPGPWIRVVLFDDRTGEQLADWGVTSDAQQAFELEAKGPTRYRVLMREWNDNASSPGAGYLLMDPVGGRDIAADTVTATADPLDPTQVFFTRAEVAGMPRPGRVDLDADGNGTVDTQVPVDGKATFRYPSEGLYTAVALMHADTGVVTRCPLWVAATGPRERRGIHLVVSQPGEGQVVERDAPVSVRALSYTGARIARVSAGVDGRSLPTSYSAPYTFDVPWRTLGPGAHELTVTATDTGGDSAGLTRKFRLSPYFGLLPLDGAVLSGNAVRVSWSGADFGPARVRYRPRATADWREAVGESGRERVVLLTDLEPGQPCEFQPLSGGEPGPVRTVTRVKGLAFGKPRYGATINRDYDQRMPISVRNHGDQPLSVRLVCGKPAGDSQLLIGFVGEGSEGAPINLGPGVEREFLLCFSAQDVVTPTHRFPIRITATNGFSDEAEVEVTVRLPVVKLEWEAVGPAPSGLGQRFRLHNKGDSLTDLAVVADSPDVTVSPDIQHGLLPAGQSTEVTAAPRLYQGFTGVAAQLIARALDKAVSTEVKIALKAGEQVYAVDLIPGQTPEAPLSDDQRALLSARALAAGALDPETVDWAATLQPADTDGDGKPDRWTFADDDDSVLWVGDDTNADGTVDFVHADVGFDGIFDYSAFKGERGWERTNIVEAWLEMGFSLPWARSAYEKHDVAVLVNTVTVGRLLNAIPEGNYAFRVPPTALRFNTQGQPEGNVIEIASQHLRGGHYVVSSDFRLKLRLTGTRVWTVATSAAEAGARAANVEGISLTAADLSISSADLKLLGPTPLGKGADVKLTVPIRSLGATTPGAVDVALQRATSAEAGVELARVTVPLSAAPAGDIAELPWKAAAGTHTLRLVLDPDSKLADKSRQNNQASLTVTVAGEDARPTLGVTQPAANATFTDPVVPISATAADDSGVAMVEARIDTGLWAPLAGDATYAGNALVQPGTHTITVRVTDTGGNQVEQAVPVTVNATTPQVAIAEPAEGAGLDAREVPVVLRAAREAVLAAARVNGGAWLPAPLADGAATVTVPLSFGPCVLEACAVTARGVMGLATVRVSCTRQPTAGETPPATLAGTGGGLLEIEGVGWVDVLSTINGVLKPRPAPAPPVP